jgi:NDP-sugar pyrophosphorylase family protein
MALRPIAEADRYETVELVEDRIAAFHPRSGAPRPGLINGGVYQAARDLIPAAAGPCSLEADILPELVASGMVSGAVFDAPFIDIGLPATYDQAQDLLRR